MPTYVEAYVQNFYPRPPRGGRRCVQLLNQRIEVISIHALREEGDWEFASDEETIRFLSTPSARRATVELAQLLVNKAFLSTPSARRATSPEEAYTAGIWTFLSTPSARRATSSSLYLPTPPMEFLSTPSARRATAATDTKIHRMLFLSTPSARRATGFFVLQALLLVVFLSTPSARRAT